MDLNLKKKFAEWRGQWRESEHCQIRPFTDDFGVPIRSILIAKQIKNRTFSQTKSILAGKRIWEGVNFFHSSLNLKNLAYLLDFQIVESSNFYYIRDCFLRLWDGLVATPYLSEELKIAIGRVHSASLYLDRAATTRTSNQLFNHWSGIAERYAQYTKCDEKLFVQPISSFQYTYVEGGNVFTLTNEKGEIVIFIGEDHRDQTLQLLELEARDWNQLAIEGLSRSMEDLSKEIMPTLTKEKVFSVCEEMYGQGLYGKKGLIDPKHQLDILLTKFFVSGERGGAGWFRGFAERTGSVEIFQLADWKESCSKAAEYLCKKKVTEALIAKDFRVLPTQVQFLAQANYHLDIFLLPGPCQSVFIVNYGYAAEVLKEILAFHSSLQLSEKDIMHLNRYFQTAKKLDQELGGLLEKVGNDIKAKGFQVIPMPAHFMYESEDMYKQFPMPSEGFCINFANGLMGSNFYITHGISVGDKLGQILMEAFKSFLQFYAPELAVYFVGYDPERPEDFSEALDSWNRLETQFGLHCVSFRIS